MVAAAVHSAYSIQKHEERDATTLVFNIQTCGIIFRSGEEKRGWQWSPYILNLISIYNSFTFFLSCSNNVGGRRGWVASSYKI